LRSSHPRSSPSSDAHVQAGCPDIAGLLEARVADDAARSDGAHRRAPVDLLVAAVAEQHHDVVLWAFDRDYRVIADVTGQPTELESTSE